MMKKDRCTWSSRWKWKGGRQSFKHDSEKEGALEMVMDLERAREMEKDILRAEVFFEAPLIFYSSKK